MFKTDPIIEDILQNFFNENDADEFSALYLGDKDATKREFKDKEIQSQIDFEIDGGLETKSQIDLLNYICRIKTYLPKHLLIFSSTWDNPLLHPGNFPQQ